MGCSSSGSWRFGVLRGAALSAALVALGPGGCKPSDGGASPSASASAGRSGAKRSVSAQDCDAWSDHGTTAMVSSITAALAACPADTRDDIRSQMALDPAAIRAAGRQLCMTHVGEAYAEDDARCFSRAADAPTLQGCRFAPMTNPKDSPWASVVGALHQACTQGHAPGAAPGPPRGVRPPTKPGANEPATPM